MPSAPRSLVLQTWLHFAAGASFWVTATMLAIGCQQTTETHIQSTRPSGQNVGEANADDVVRTDTTTGYFESDSAAEALPDGLLETALCATLRIISGDGGFDGSGVLVGRALDGHAYALTALHIVRAESIGRVDVFDLASFPRPNRSLGGRKVDVVAKSERRDLALLRLTVDEGNTRGIAIPDAFATAMRAYSVGCTGGEAPTLLPEQLIGATRVKRPNQTGSMLMWKTESPSISGRSGGALLDESGNLLGIALGTSGREGYYCHRDEIVRFLRQNAFETLLEPRPEDKPAETP